MKLKDYLNVIQKRWWIPVLVAIVAAATAFGYSLTQPKTYTATAKLIGTVGKPDPGLYASLEQQINGYKQIFTGTQIADKINQRGQFDLSSDAIISKIKVQALPADKVFVITVDDTNAARAAAIANAAANILVDENEARIAALNADQQVFVNNAAPASVPDKPSGPRTNLLAGAGLALGLVIGIILMFAIEFLDDSFKSEEDVERYTSLTVLGAVPIWKHNGEAKLVRPTISPPAADASSDSVTSKSKQKERV